MATERHNGCPQDTEWAIADGKAWLVQARPITTLHHATMTAPESHDVVARGLPAAPGEASGTVRVLLTPAEGGQLLDGEVLVAQMTNPDWLPTMRRAAALVTDTGGMTCHAAIVARELGVPCVVGARTATTDLQDGMVVTVDGTHGRVLTGRVMAGGARRLPSRRRRPPAARGLGGDRHQDLRQPGHARHAPNALPPRRRRRRVAARGVHADRGARAAGIRAT